MTFSMLQHLLMDYELSLTTTFMESTIEANFMSKSAKEMIIELLARSHTKSVPRKGMVRLIVIIASTF